MITKRQKTKPHFIRYGIISLCTLLTANVLLLLVSCSSGGESDAQRVNNTAQANNSFTVNSEINESPISLIFVSKLTTTGNILGSVESIFGKTYPNDIAAADDLCSNDSQCTSGYCQAVISDGQNRISPSWQGSVYNYGTDWVLAPNTSYYNTSKQFIGKTNWSQVIINESSEPYFTNPVLPGSKDSVWTGINPGWDPAPEDSNCHGFLTSSAGVFAQGTSSGALTIDQSYLTCNNKAHLYCVGNPITSSNNTWVSGSNTGNESGVYGKRGIPSKSNTPGARDGSISFVDKSGNLWLFGGWRYDKKGDFNDLWKYNIQNNTWTWVSGSDTGNESGVYGTLGIPSESNIPGARDGSISFVDNSGNLWLFGGWGYDVNGKLGSLNDLWKYNIQNNTWTWVSGSNTINERGVYGTKGIESASNIPGDRSVSISFVDKSGNLWLFGGVGDDVNGTSGILNDLWKYNIQNNTWTWVSGSNTVNQSGIYGTRGSPNTSNIPGARDGSISFVDESGNLWLFGGLGVMNGGVYYLNDLWKYNIQDNAWTWVSGSNTVNQSGIYGTRGSPNTSNIPGARYGSVSFVDKSGNLWLFGGLGVNGGGRPYLNDLWQYNIQNNTWTWVSGSNTGDESGIYGTRGIPSESNIPGARYGSVSFVDNSGNLWLFGGRYSADSFNDLWRLLSPSTIK